VSFRVDDGGQAYVARCGEDLPVHHVYREREVAASRAAFAAGLAPELVYAERGVVVVRYIDGRTLEEPDLAANLPRIAALLRACHYGVARHLAGPINVFPVFDVIRGYARTLAAAGVRATADLARYAALADALERQQVPLPVVFGHHDLLPGNFLDDGARLWLIDWEYSGFGTAMFDLANIAANGNFSAADDRRLLDEYFGGPVGDATLRAFDAMKAASALRETLWAMVSAVHLDLSGVDYDGHAARFLARTEMALAEFGRRHGSVDAR
jgi:thiamine kinase-like enzyme